MKRRIALQITQEAAFSFGSQVQLSFQYLDTYSHCSSKDMAREVQSASLPSIIYFVAAAKRWCEQRNLVFFLNSWHNQRCATVKRISFFNEVQRISTMEELHRIHANYSCILVSEQYTVKYMT